MSTAHCHLDVIVVHSELLNYKKMGLDFGMRLIILTMLY
jgi:hypothetical protein